MADVLEADRSPGSVTFDVLEYENIKVPISDLLVAGELDLYPDIVAHNWFDISLKRRELLVRASGFVGLIPLNDRVVLNVRPRVPITNLGRMLEVSKRSPVAIARYLRNYELEPHNQPELLDLLTDAFLDHLAPIEARGVHREYVRLERQTSSPRGRILQHQTLSLHSRGPKHRVVVSTFDRTVDTPLNRCLKLTLWMLALTYSRMPIRKGLRNRLARLSTAIRTFDGAQLDSSLEFLADEAVRDPAKIPPLRDYYRFPLELALMFIQDMSLALDRRTSHGLRFGSLLLDMNRLFEHYIRNALGARLGEIGSLRAEDGNSIGEGFGGKLFFDEPPSEPAAPDIVVKGAAGPPVAIIDVKYKPVSGDPDRDDLNQVIAYGASYATPSVCVVQPSRKGSSGLRRLGTIGGLSVFQYEFDLATPDLEQQELQLAKAINGLDTTPT
jgi:5-methylcytosine-specific restriction enzyme subunit McrC